MAVFFLWSVLCSYCVSPHSFWIQEHRTEAPALGSPSLVMQGALLPPVATGGVIPPLPAVLLKSQAWSTATRSPKPPTSEKQNKTQKTYNPPTAATEARPLSEQEGQVVSKSKAERSESWNSLGPPPTTYLRGLTLITR